ncbi:hypothetical protein HAX54_032700 [Datura stramonium]|uniref:Uncharacterized protein n=1 Tax=Datura stramonium TaxID=4076 RepID=A0ABS8VCJ0_DATST|nr:hypothetical protein [Datura stramonium]
MPERLSFWVSFLPLLLMVQVLSSYITCSVCPRYPENDTIAEFNASAHEIGVRISEEPKEPLEVTIVHHNQSSKINVDDIVNHS